MPSLARLLLALLIVLRPATALPQSNFDDLPNLGDASGQIISPQQDKALGAYFMRQIRQSGIILEAQEATG